MAALEQQSVGGRRWRWVVDSDTAGGCEGAGAGLVLKIARCSRLMQIVCVCVWVFDAERTWSGVEWSEPW